MLDYPTLIYEAGLSVFLQYKGGSSRQGKGSAKYKVPDMQWVGLRPSQLDDLDLPEEASSAQEQVVPLAYAFIRLWDV